VRYALVVLGCFVVTGCGGGAPEKLQGGKMGCEEAVGQGVSPGRASARLIAQSTVAYQADDLKGFMLRDGYRAVLVKGRRVDCRGSELGGGLSLCVARLQVCGR
jgi:hypothetical protein